jgi:uncharacterized membrane protein YeaQ/YmgE (transglycosylase-associated protein family)
VTVNNTSADDTSRSRYTRSLALQKNIEGEGIFNFNKESRMNRSVTLHFVPEQVITWVIIGLIAGLLAGFLIRGRRSGFVWSVVVGLLGALLGGFLFSVLNIKLPSAFDGGITLAWADMVVAFIGAVIILIAFGGFYRSRR